MRNQSAVLVQPGYYRPDEDWKWSAREQATVVRCPQRGACLGGPLTGAATCAKGHTGPLCGVCSPGYYRGTEQCEICPTVGNGTIWGTILLMLGIAVGVCGVFFGLYFTHAAEEEIEEPRSRSPLNKKSIPSPYVIVKMPSSLQPTYGPSIVVSVGLSDKVADVKTAVEAAVGTPAADQTLTFNTTPLTSDAATLASASVPNGGTLDLAVSSVPSTAFIIHVELPPALQPTHGSTLTLISSASATVADVKAQVASVTGMSSAEQALAFGSLALMSDPQMMGDAGVATGDTLTLSTPSPYVIVKMPASLLPTYSPSIVWCRSVHRTQ